MVLTNAVQYRRELNWIGGGGMNVEIHYEMNRSSEQFYKWNHSLMDWR